MKKSLLLLGRIPWTFILTIVFFLNGAVSFAFPTEWDIQPSDAQKVQLHFSDVVAHDAQSYDRDRIASELEFLPAQAIVEGFELRPGPRCRPEASELTKELCKAIGAKEWSPSEIETFKRLISETKRRGLGTLITEVQKLGFTALYRTSFVPMLAGSVYSANGNSPVQTWMRKTRLMLFADLLFRYFDLPYRLLNTQDELNYGVYIFVHECMHALDADFVFSNDPSFVITTPLQIYHEKQQFFGISERFGAMIYQWRNALNRSVQQCYAESRQVSIYGIDLTCHRQATQAELAAFQYIGLPSNYAVANLTEMYAEVGASLLLDPKARGYLDQPLMNYVSQSLSQRGVSLNF